MAEWAVCRRINNNNNDDDDDDDENSNKVDVPVDGKYLPKALFKEGNFSMSIF